MHLELKLSILLSNLLRTESEEVIERICNQSGQSKRHEDVLWNQKRRKMFHGASGLVYLRDIYPRCSTDICLEPTSKKRKKRQSV
jgi:hypothetical protein